MGWPLDKNFTCIICFNSQQCSQFQFTERKLEKTRQCTAPLSLGRLADSVAVPRLPPDPWATPGFPSPPQIPMGFPSPPAHTPGTPQCHFLTPTTKGRRNTDQEKLKAGTTFGLPHSQVYCSHDLNGNLDRETSISIGSVDILNPTCPKQTHCRPPTLVLFLVPF